MKDKVMTPQSVKRIGFDSLMIEPIGESNRAISEFLGGEKSSDYEAKVMIGARDSVPVYLFQGGDVSLGQDVLENLRTCIVSKGFRFRVFVSLKKNKGIVRVPEWEELLKDRCGVRVKVPKGLQELARYRKDVLSGKIPAKGWSTPP